MVFISTGNDYYVSRYALETYLYKFCHRCAKLYMMYLYHLFLQMTIFRLKHVSNDLITTYDIYM